MHRLIAHALQVGGRTRLVCSQDAPHSVRTAQHESTDEQHARGADQGQPFAGKIPENQCDRTDGKQNHAGAEILAGHYQPQAQQIS